MPRKPKLPADCMPMCSTCAFCRKDDEGGMCHRYPPVAVTDDEGFGFTHIPVAPDDWCGEYQRRVN